MCTLVILRRPSHHWPLLLAANRDELTARPWKPPGRHWPKQPEAVGGLDELAGGTWLAINRFGLVAAVLNRVGSLGPAPGLRSRGELPLLALEGSDAADAAERIAALSAKDYRSFNLVVADQRDAFWLRNRGDDGPGRIEVFGVKPGLQMITAHDLNDLGSGRIRNHLHHLRQLPAPDPDAGQWNSWIDTLASRVYDAAEGPSAAMTVSMPERGYATICSSLIALPAPSIDPDRPKPAPVFLFCPEPPRRGLFQPVKLEAS